MIIYELTTNEGTKFVRRNPRPGMIPYIKAKLAQGWKLADILYTWTQHTVY